MLKGKNVVIVKGEKGTPSTVEEYTRVYLEFSDQPADMSAVEGKPFTGDATEEFEKTSEGKDLEVNGQIWKGIRPKEKNSLAKTAQLMGEALHFFAERYPSDNPYNTLLSAASYGNDLWERNRIQAGLRPSKPIDKGAAIAKMVKVLMSLNPKMSLSKATAVAAAASEEGAAA